MVGSIYAVFGDTSFYSAVYGRLFLAGFALLHSAGWIFHVQSGIVRHEACVGVPTHRRYLQNTSLKLHEIEISDKPAVSISRADDEDRRENLKSHKPGNCRQILLNSLVLNFIQIRPSVFYVTQVHEDANRRTFFATFDWQQRNKKESKPFCYLFWRPTCPDFVNVWPAP